jgi:hypothetical protein
MPLRGREENESEFDPYAYREGNEGKTYVKADPEQDNGLVP